MVFSCLPIKLKPEFLATASVVKITHMKIINTSSEIKAVLGALFGVFVYYCLLFFFYFHILYYIPFIPDTIVSGELVNFYELIVFALRYYL